MNARNGTMSPVSLGGSEWSDISKYQFLETDSPYSPNSSNRGQLASPPISSGSNSTMNGAFPPRLSSNNVSPGGPSPPSSIARSSVGAGLYAPSESGTSKKDEQYESILSEHYLALRRYLAASLRDEKGNPRPNRARDKLLRLSSVQFQELSTDVFDELVRRQQSGRRPVPEGQPLFLLPKETFHPKRNQARQKLSTLPPLRFRDLATDVFYELERRFPRFASGEMNGNGSPATSMRGPPSRNGTPVNGTRIRRPSDASSIAYSMRSESRNGQRVNMSGNNIPLSPGLASTEFGRPQAKMSVSSTIVPNKSIMVEDDETGGEEDDEGGVIRGAFGSDDKQLKDRASSDMDKKLLEDYESQVAELRGKIDAMEDRFKLKNDELKNVLEIERQRFTALDLEKKEWSSVRLDLEAQLADAQTLNDSLQAELDRVRASQANTEWELQSQIEELRSAGESRGAAADVDLVQENQELRKELDQHQKVTEEVRVQAQEILREMRVLSDQSGSWYEREEQLSNKINKLEEEVKDWRNRYARTKTQLRSLRASSIGLTILYDAARCTKDNSFTHQNGMVKDVNVTKFQISIDELLQIARTADPVRVMEFMKAVIVNVRSITQDLDEAGGDLSPQQIKLKSRVSATANNIITASKNFAAAKGISPVSLLDAAASHLTTAVVELIRTVKIRPSPAGELEDDDEGFVSPIDPTGFFPVRDPRSDSVISPLVSSNIPPPIQGLRNGRTSADSSMYSPIESPRETLRPRSSAPRPLSRGLNGYATSKETSSFPTIGTDFGIQGQEESEIEELRNFLEDQTALLVQSIQLLVSAIRSDSGITAIGSQIISISDVVNTVISTTEKAISTTGNEALRQQGGPIVNKLLVIRKRLIEAGDTGRQISNEAREDEEAERTWRSWTQSLPPIAFEIARETKDLVTHVDGINSAQNPGQDDDFS